MQMATPAQITSKGTLHRARNGEGFALLQHLIRSQFELDIVLRPAVRDLPDPADHALDMRLFLRRKATARRSSQEPSSSAV